MPKDEFDQDDPMELVGVSLVDPDGDLLARMARCIIEEYFMIGFGREEILGLFHDPFYQSPHEIYRRKGDDYLKGLIEEVLRNWGVRR